MPGKPTSEVEVVAEADDPLDYKVPTIDGFEFNLDAWGDCNPGMGGIDDRKRL